MAIAFDAATDGGASGVVSGPYTFTHTVGSGSNRILFLAILFGIGPDNVTGVTYNGNAMTRIRTDSFPGGSIRGYIYYIVNPTSGSNTVSISYTGSAVVQGMAVSYSGALQTGVPDAQVSSTATSATSLTETLTTVSDNCWTLLHELNSVGTATAGTGSTQRLNSGGMGVFDSNGSITPPGSHAMTVTGTSRDWLGQMISFAPAVSALTAGSPSVSAIGLTTATVTCTAASGGTPSYTYQWQRSLTSGSGYSNVSGATSLTLNDTGLTRGTTYYYQLVVTDSASATATSSEINLTTKTSQLVASGNSQTAGAGGTSWSTQIAVMIGSTWQIDNTAIGGQTTLNIISDYNNQIGKYYNALNSVNFVSIQEVMNDIYFNATSQQAHDDLKTLCLLAQATGFSVFVMLSQPDRGDFPGTSTLPGGTGAAQRAVFQSRWAGFLSLFLADWYTYCDGFIYPNQDVQIVVSDPTYISASDLVHWTTLTQGIVATQVTGAIAATLNPNPGSGGGAILSRILTGM